MIIMLSRAAVDMMLSGIAVINMSGIAVINMFDFRLTVCYYIQVCRTERLARTDFSGRRIWRVIDEGGVLHVCSNCNRRKAV